MKGSRDAKKSKVLKGWGTSRQPKVEEVEETCCERAEETNHVNSQEVVNGLNLSISGIFWKH